MEVLKDRLETLQTLDDQGGFAGKYFSKEWIQKNVLQMDEIEIKEVEDQLKKSDDPEYSYGQPTKDEDGNPLPINPDNGGGSNFDGNDSGSNFDDEEEDPLMKEFDEDDD